MIWLSTEPRGDDYAGLLRAMLHVCDRALLVVRDGIAVNLACERKLAHLAAWRLRSDRRAAWPGTTLLSGSALVTEYRFDEEACAVLTELADGLYDWQQPSAPEDLALVREDGRAALVTVAHERDGYLDLTREELARLDQVEASWSALLRRISAQS